MHRVVLAEHDVTVLGPIVISSVDRARLEPMVRDAVAGGIVSRQLLCALKSKLDAARVLDPGEMPRDAVTMNSVVRVRDLDTEEVEAYTLVYPAFADFTKNLMSILTPVGVSLLGHRAGDTVDGIPLLGPSRLRIEEVQFQPESAGQYDV